MSVYCRCYVDMSMVSNDTEAAYFVIDLIECSHPTSNELTGVDTRF